MNLISCRIVPLLLICGITFLGASCEKLDENAPLNLVGGKPLIIGHGGSGFVTMRNTVPPNTMESIIHAMESEDADGIECDIRLSGDSVLVVIHDMELATATNCKGCLDSIHSGDLSGCIYRNTFSSGLHNYEIPLLEEIYNHFKNWNPHPWISLNVKTDVCEGDEFNSGRMKTYSGAIVAMIRKYSAEQVTIIESPTVEFLREVHALDSNLLIMLDGNSPDQELPLIRAEGWDGIVSNLYSITAEQVETAHAGSLFVVVYGVKLRQDAVKAFNLGVDMIQTDDIRMCRAVGR